MKISPNSACFYWSNRLRWGRGLALLCFVAIIALYWDAQLALAQSGSCTPSPTLFYNQASVSADQSDPNLTDNTAESCTPLLLITSYVVGKELITIDPVRPGDDITFTVRITNTGQTVLTTLPISDTYNRRYLAYVGATPAADDSNDDGQIDWSDLTTALGDLAPNGVAVLTVRFTAFSDTSLLPGGATPNRAAGHDAFAGATPAPNPPVATAQVRINAPTVVTLANPRATYADGKVTLQWDTVSEVQAVGYYLWRVDEITGEQVQLITQLLEAQKAGQTAGATYGYSDATVQPGHTYRYVLEVVDINGQHSYNTIAVLTAGRLLYLPLVRR